MVSRLFLLVLAAGAQAAALPEHFRVEYRELHRPAVIVSIDRVQDRYRIAYRKGKTKQEGTFSRDVAAQLLSDFGSQGGNAGRKGKLCVGKTSWKTTADGKGKSGCEDPKAQGAIEELISSVALILR